MSNLLVIKGPNVGVKYALAEQTAEFGRRLAE